jgi:pyruvate kinase
MDVARLNFSYGTYEEHGRVIRWIRDISARLGRPVGLMADLAGPKLRVGELRAGAVLLKVGQEVVLDTRDRPAPTHIPVPLPELAAAVTRGARLLLSDGRIELKVAAVKGGLIHCTVRVGGELRSHQGVNVPESALPIRTVTKKDLADLEFALQQGVDWVAMSFVRRGGDLRPLRRAMRSVENPPAIMSKVEQHEAIEHLDEIVAESDGVMVARGDLGIEVVLDRVPLLQKEIIARCNAAGKPVVTATQMLESMIENPRPTRAEVSDIANAVFDGTDAVMLSGETAVGKHPAEAVRVMASAALRAEGAFDYERRLEESTGWPCRTVTEGISQATCSLARDLGARAIITPTATGHTPMMVAMHRPEMPIVAVTPNMATLRRLTLVWGVHPVLAPRGDNTDELIVRAIDAALGAGYVRKGDTVVLTAGVPAGVPGRTNMIKVEQVGQHVSI